jgi:hypothetical protein
MPHLARHPQGLVRRPEAHAANLFDLNAKYADVLEVGEVLSMLEMM